MSHFPVILEYPDDIRSSPDEVLRAAWRGGCYGSRSNSDNPYEEETARRVWWEARSAQRKADFQENR